MKRHSAKLITALTCLAVATAGCVSHDSTATGGAKTLKVAFVTNNSADFWTIARRGVETVLGQPLTADARQADGIRTEILQQ